MYSSEVSIIYVTGFGSRSLTIKYFYQMKISEFFDSDPKAPCNY